MNGIELEKIERTQLIKINRPGRRNAIDYDTAVELEKATEVFENDESADVLVLTGDENSFCAGADLNDVERLSWRVLSEEGPLGFTRKLLSKPVIAAISGYCVAGGLEIALWADIRVVDSNALFGFLERRFGVPLIDGGTQRLPRIIGLGRALDLILTGRKIDSKEAFEIGLVNYVVPEGEALKKALEIAAIISTFPQLTLRNDRTAVFSGLGTTLREGLGIEAEIGKKTIEQHGMDSVELFLQGKGRSGRPVSKK